MSRRALLRNGLNAGVEDRMRVLAAGYQMHIPKPVEQGALATVVARLAERYAHLYLFSADIKNQTLRKSQQVIRVVILRRHTAA